jgi:hypothetical protein
MKNDANPINPIQRLRDAPRCSATAKSTRQRCQSPAVRGWSVCRMHGAGGGASPGKAHPNYKHGMRTKEWTGRRKLVNELVRDLQPGE